MPPRLVLPDSAQHPAPPEAPTDPRDAEPCTGCRHVVGAVCRRFPPVWTTQLARETLEGMQMTQGGWSFPPAARRCGEFGA